MSFQASSISPLSPLPPLLHPPPAFNPIPDSANQTDAGTSATNPAPPPLETEPQLNPGAPGQPPLRPGIYVIDTPGVYSVNAAGFITADFTQSSTAGAPIPPIFVMNTTAIYNAHSTQPSTVPPSIPSEPEPPGSPSTDSRVSWTSSLGEIKKRRIWGRVRALKFNKAPPPFSYRTFVKNFRRFRALYRYDRALRFGTPDFRYARQEVFGEREWFKGKTKRGIQALEARLGGGEGLGASGNELAYDSDVDLCEMVNETDESDTDFDEEEELKILEEEGRKYADSNGEWSYVVGASV